MKVHVLMIDPQKSFCQAPNPKMANAMMVENGGKTNPAIDFVRNGGELFVSGADEDCIRLANMVRRLKNKIDAIHITLDSHNEVDIAHPCFWRDSKGNHPNPFTIITKDDVVKGRYTTSNPACLKRATDYVTQLEINARYPLCIWPPHCIIGSEGHSVEDNVSSAVREWCRDRFRLVNYVTKGSNPWTEHYSAIMADVPDNSDPTTLLNSEFISAIDSSDVALITGQALSHCVNFTIRDLVKNFGPESIKKLVLIRDTCSSVPGFEKQGNDFINDMVALGMRVDTSTNIFA